MWKDYKMAQNTTEGLLNNPQKPQRVEKSELLTSLDFLSTDATWPPASQVTRLARYKLNKSKFDNKLNINMKAYKYIISLVDNNFRVISYRMLVNLYRKVTYKTADLLFVERPTYIVAKKEDGEEVKATQETLDEIVTLSKLGKIGYQGAEDVSIYGDAIYTIKIPAKQPGTTEDGGAKEQEKARMGITNPRYWFPVVSETDLSEIKHHVLAHVVTRLVVTDGEEKETDFLIYQIHERGSYTTHERVINDERKLEAESVLEEGETNKVDTGLSDFAVVPTAGVTTSDSIFGIDDYTDIINLIDELQIRMEKIAHVLDKHSDPSMSGPAEALQLNKETGEYSVKLGGYFQRSTKDSPDVNYITWDGKLDPSFKEIELILNLLSIITEMGAAIFDREKGGAGDLSGRALKLLYVNPLTKVARVRNNFDDAFKHALSLCSEVGYPSEIPQKDISIAWKDGLPNDPKELAEVGQIRAGRPTDTVVSQIMVQDGLSEEAAIKKAEAVNLANMSDIPMIGAGGFGDLVGVNAGQVDVTEPIATTLEETRSFAGRVVDFIRNLTGGETE